MDELSINPKFLQNLILHTRAAMDQDLTRRDQEGNQIDRDDPALQRYDQRDRSEDELVGEIDDLEPDQKAELVALMWIGRGDMEAEEWDDAVALALERQQGSTAEYLLSHPQLAEHLDEGLDKLFDGSNLVETGEY